MPRGGDLCSVDDESDAENVTRNEARAFAERRRRPLRLITGSRFANEKIDFGVLRFPGARYRHDVGRMHVAQDPGVCVVRY